MNPATLISPAIEGDNLGLKARPRTLGPIELEMRSRLSKLTGCTYPDTFDWSVYDKIAERFGDQQPRGGVVFKTTFKLINHHSSCTKCHYAFEIDTYGRGCVHNCVYCYAKAQLTTHGFWNRPMPFPVDLADIRKVFYTVFETTKASKWRSVLEQRIPIRLGSMSDCFMGMDKKYKVTLELLKILRHYSYPYIVVTRSDLVAADEYLEVLDKDLASIQFSLVSVNEKMTKLIEPGAPTPQRRLSALKTLNREGFWTTVRVNPLFPIYPDGYFTDTKSIEERFGSRANAPRFDFFSWDLVDAVKETGTPTLMAGLVRLSTWAINNLSTVTGADIRSFFRPEIAKTVGDKRYSDSEIAYYYTQLKMLCAQKGLRFTTCYIGNGEKDYYQYQGLWDNKSDCCDARGNVKAFQKTSQDISWKDRTQHAPCKDMAKKSEVMAVEVEKQYAPLANRPVEEIIASLPIAATTKAPARKRPEGLSYEEIANHPGA